MGYFPAFHRAAGGVPKATRLPMAQGCSGVSGGQGLPHRAGTDDHAPRMVRKEKQLSTSDILLFITSFN